MYIFKARIYTVVNPMMPGVGRVHESWIFVDPNEYDRVVGAIEDRRVGAQFDVTIINTDQKTCKRYHGKARTYVNVLKLQTVETKSDLKVITAENSYRTFDMWGEYY